MKKNKIGRQRAALQRLEVAYEKFKAAGEDKVAWSSTRNGREIQHVGRKYAEECKRMSEEIKILKDRINRHIEK